MNLFKTKNLFGAKNTKTKLNTRITAALANEINEAIRGLIAYYTPSGTNGRVDMWKSAVKNYFITNGIDEGSYWQYVFDKAPKKAVR